MRSFFTNPGPVDKQCSKSEGEVTLFPCTPEVAPHHSTFLHIWIVLPYTGLRTSVEFSFSFWCPY